MTTPPVTLDAIVATATDADPAQRFATAREMAVALEAAVAPAPAREVTAWLREVAGARIERVSAVMRRIESDVQSEPGRAAHERHGSLRIVGEHARRHGDHPANGQRLDSSTPGRRLTRKRPADAAAPRSAAGRCPRRCSPSRR